LSLKNSTSGHIEVNWFGAISTPFIARWGQKIAIGLTGHGLSPRGAGVSTGRFTKRRQRRAAEARRRIEPKSKPQVVFIAWPIPSEESRRCAT
jgi:hypothetical protein